MRTPLRRLMLSPRAPHVLWGYELASLVGGVVEAGEAESSLAPDSLERLASLERELAIDVFVTPT